jgi:CSLREA domain-containing protein
VGPGLNTRAWIAGVFLTTALVLAPVSAQGATINVDTTADQAGSKPKECALREAVVAANSDAPFGGCKRGEEGDAIVLGAKTYLLTRSGSGEEMAMRGDLDVTGELKIRGAGQERTTIDARDASDRHFDGKAGAAIELSDLTLDKGSLDEFNGGSLHVFLGALQLNRVTVRRSVGPGGAGAIAGNASDVTVKRSLIEKNRADLAGGGITAGNGSLTILRSRISNNRSGSFGGGIYPNNADVVIKRSVIEGNRAPDQAGMALLAGTFEISKTRIVGNIAEGSGGGVYTLAADGEISQSEVSGNVAGADGGGLQILSDDISIVASTISGNEARGNGGGLYLDGTNAEVILNGATVANNQADSNADDVGSGGGIFVDAGVGIFYNSILGDNSLGGASGGETECDGGIGAVYTLIENDCPGLGSNNIVADPGLKRLEKNGGPTRTHALRSDSLAIDAGNPSLPGSEDSSCIPTDQRGKGRPTGECDMGAFELNGF